MNFIKDLIGTKGAGEMEKRALYETIDKLSGQIIQEVRAIFNLNKINYIKGENNVYKDIEKESFLENSMTVMEQQIKADRAMSNGNLFRSIRGDIEGDELSKLINERNNAIGILNELNIKYPTESRNPLNRGGGGFTATSERVMINGKQNRIVYKKNGKGVGYVKMNGEFVKMNSKNIKK
jgi:hypothetical protein